MKRRPPDRPERVAHARHRQAGELGVDEDDAVIRVDGDLVPVEVAGVLGVAREVERVEMLVGELARPEHVLKPPDADIRHEKDALGVGVDAHGARKVALVERNPAVLHHADEEELPGLVGGEGERSVARAEPIGEAARRGDLACLLLRGGLASRRASLSVLRRSPPRSPASRGPGRRTRLNRRERRLSLCRRFCIELPRHKRNGPEFTRPAHLSQHLRRVTKRCGRRRGRRAPGSRRRTPTCRAQTPTSRSPRPR